MMTQWRMDLKEEIVFSPDKIFTASLQKFWWVQIIINTRNGFALTDF